jgi:glyoxylase-like metal-dependent hydrolase (beta-lactamase superfamily II)
MLVKLEAQNIILVADAAYIPKNMEQRLLTAVVWSPDAMVASWERIEEVQARENAKLIFTHDLDWSSKTRLAPKEWYE